MRLRVSLVTLGLLSMAVPLLAQHNCPQGFNDAGTLKGTGSYGIPFDERREINLPENATLDTSFQQSNVRVRAGNDLAQSKLQAKDIPKGILIIPSGSTHVRQWLGRQCARAKDSGRARSVSVRNEALLYLKHFTFQQAHGWLRRVRGRLLQAEEVKRGTGNPQRRAGGL